MLLSLLRVCVFYMHNIILSVKVYTNRIPREIQLSRPIECLTVWSASLECFLVDIFRSHLPDLHFNSHKQIVRKECDKALNGDERGIINNGCRKLLQEGSGNGDFLKLL